jgi:hypothetical protein
MSGDARAVGQSKGSNIVDHCPAHEQAKMKRDYADSPDER